MAMPWLDPYLLALVDAWYRAIPRARPSPEQLAAVRIISHRGERSARVPENTFAAFDALPGKVWGLECDVRFSRDGVPMVFHDPDLARIYGCDQRLCDLDAAELRQRFPFTPTLAELAQRYAGRIHLMLEFKAEARPQSERRLQAVREALAALRPGQDYHLMSLDCTSLDWLGQGFPSSSLVAIARSNVEQMSRYALHRNCAGLAGHFALLRARHAQPHIARGQWVGLGFPASRNALRFAVQQGASHIFTNQALTLQSLLAQENNASKA